MTCRLCIICLVGIPACGKTTLCKFLTKSSSEPEFVISYISFDEEIKNFKVGEWKEERKLVMDKTDKLVSIKLELSDASPEVILLDDNMFYRSMRYDYLKIARKYNIGYGLIFIESSLEKSLLRNSQRKEGYVPAETIENMFEKIERPSGETYWWEKNLVVLEADFELNEITKSQVFKLFSECLKNPIPKIEVVSSTKQTVGTNHYVDLSIRLIIQLRVKEFIDLNPSCDVSELSKRLVAKKKEVMSCIKSGSKLIPQFSEMNEAKIIENYVDFLQADFDATT